MKPRYLAAAVFILLLQAGVNLPRLWSDAPYEGYDEINSLNTSYVTKGPSHYRGYSYGTVDTFLYVISRVYYAHFDPVGRKYARVSYSNNVPRTLSDPYLMYRPVKDWSGVDYGYFRGLGDRFPIFLSRVLHFLVFYGIFFALIVWSFRNFGYRALPLFCCLMLFGGSDLLFSQAAFGLPNGINALSAAAFTLALLVACYRDPEFPLAGAAVILGLAINDKIDVLPLLLPLGAAALVLGIRTGSARRFWRIVLLTGSCLVGTILLTRPALFVHPGREYLSQLLNANTIMRRPQPWQNLLDAAPPLANLLVLPESWATRAPLLLLGGITAWTLLLVALSQWRRRPSWPLLSLGALCLLLPWAVPILKASYLYDRYTLMGSAVLMVVWGAALGALLESPLPRLRAFAKIFILVVALVWVSAFSHRAYDSVRLARALASHGGLDPSYSRNQAAWEALQLLKTGRYQPTILIDQHAYLDARIFLTQGYEVKWIHLGNYASQLQAAAKGGKPTLILHAPGQYATGADWAGEDWTQADRGNYDRFRATLGQFKKVDEFGSETFALLSPHPPHQHTRVVLLESP